ncbi:hypothetical protein NLJ89_g6715 [Agrocybe chaxingu]|uniref:Ribosomal eL28/Mak16 domain-containing protein n=1 Tax=Agrocybe chaxingu TaxID=84603 RepID=A0A9W8K512_9AGAR|nr:hypothetical protein NLJ89_g6715 [Agrocybe chaxingu]
MSNDLQWLLLRKNNSFIVKRVVEGPVFSREPTIDISEKGGNITVVTRKVKASPHQVKSAFAKHPVRPRSGARRALGVAAAPAKRGYRPDLRRAALARISALVASQTAGSKPDLPKKVRGKKAAHFLG